MSVSATIPPTVHIRRSRLAGLVGAVAAVAAGITWAVLAFGVDTGGGSTQANVPAPAALSSPIPMTGYLDGITSTPSVVPQPAGTHAGPYMRRAIMSFSPAELSAFADQGYVVQSLTREVVPQPAGTHAGPYMRRAIMSFSPAELSAFADQGYVVPSLTRESVLASLDPRSRRYVEAVTALTFEQLAAGAAGSP